MLSVMQMLTSLPVSTTHNFTKEVALHLHRHLLVVTVAVVGATAVSSVLDFKVEEIDQR